MNDMSFPIIDPISAFSRIQSNKARKSHAPSWRNFCQSVEMDAITPDSPEVHSYKADNGFATLSEAYQSYIADECFVCAILGHRFPYDAGRYDVELDAWVHDSAREIGTDDQTFNYGREG